MALLGCSESNLPPFTSWGYMNADMNGQEWQSTYRNAYQVTQALFPDASANACSRENHLVSSLFSTFGEERRELRFENFPLKVGQYKVHPQIINYECKASDSVRAVLYICTADGDVVEGSYNVVPSESNIFQITKYNSENEEITGTFQVTFTTHSPLLLAYLPDTLRFTHGIFHSKNVPPLKRKR